MKMILVCDRGGLRETIVRAYFCAMGLLCCRARQVDEVGHRGGPNRSAGPRRFTGKTSWINVPRGTFQAAFVLDHISAQPRCCIRRPEKELQSFLARWVRFAQSDAAGP
jgi:hypothetical protein